MVHIHLRLRISRGNGQAYCYRVAEQNLSTDCPIPDMVYFRQTCPDENAHVSRLKAYQVPGDGKEIYRGPGWIGNKWREVTCTSHSTGYHITIDGIGAFWVARDGENVVCTMEVARAGIELLIEAALGPAFILALALRRTWCWHASAVLVNNRVIVFLGESGKGKSTLAHWLGQQEQGSWRRIGDDILPVSAGASGVDILPYFPQLKIPAGEQPAIGLPERLPLAAVYVLNRPAAGEGVETRLLGMQDTVLALVRHTVASRLFDADLLAKHLDFCVHAASEIPVRELLYPLTPGALPLVLEALLDDIQAVDISEGILVGHNT